MSYRVKPRIILAFQVPVEPPGELPPWIIREIFNLNIRFDSLGMHVLDDLAEPGQYVIEDGEQILVVRPQEFESRYEQVPEPDKHEPDVIAANDNLACNRLEDIHRIATDPNMRSDVKLHNIAELSGGFAKIPEYEGEREAARAEE